MLNNKTITVNTYIWVDLCIIIDIYTENEG